MMSRSEEMTIIAIDPGASGGIAVDTQSGKVLCFKMPDTPADILDLLRGIVFAHGYDGICAVMENVGGYMPGNSGPAACKFSRHMGHLDMALLATEIPTTLVTPAKWMRHLGIPSKMDKKDRKNRIKAEMQRRHPDIKVTLWTADALGILAWARETQR